MSHHFYPKSGHFLVLHLSIFDWSFFSWKAVDRGLQNFPEIDWLGRSASLPLNEFFADQDGCMYGFWNLMVCGLLRVYGHCRCHFITAHCQVLQMSQCKIHALQKTWKYASNVVFMSKSPVAVFLLESWKCKITKIIVLSDFHCTVLEMLYSFRHLGLTESGKWIFSVIYIKNHLNIGIH